MATNSLHLNPRSPHWWRQAARRRLGAFLAVAAVVALSACASEHHATASVAATVTGREAPTLAARQPEGTSTAPTPVDSPPSCPLRLPRRLPAREIVVPILMYHRIAFIRRASTPVITRHLTVHPADFERQMRWLKRHGYHTVTQQELFAALMCGERLRRKPIMITLDDGYRDTYTQASPILQRLGMRATAYVITGRISGADKSFLTWRQVHGLERRGVEIASHTVSHRGLPLLSDAEAFDELVRSRKTLERKLGHRVPWLAYPFGAYDPRIESLARRAGYLLATTTELDARQSARRPLALPRLRVLDTTGVSGLAAVLTAYT
jgi:peptidoglycan/xylan/chitin deacetylase (PgdA/CDA1 family)